MVTLVNLLIVVVVLAIVFGVALWIVDQLGIGAPFKGYIRAVIGLIALVIVLGYLGGVWTPVGFVR